MEMMTNTEKNPVFAGLEGKSPEVLFSSLPTPCYILDEGKLIENGKILKHLMERTGCKVLLAQKAFSNFNLYPSLAPYLAGTEASGLYEARLGKEEMPDKEVHVFCGAYAERDFEELLQYADHIVFNSPTQLKRFGKRAKAAGKSIGLRINPECSTQEGHAIYDPCAKGSRLGTTRAIWDKKMTPELIRDLDGLHFHTLCEQDAEDLETTFAAVEEKFGEFLPYLKWINLGGGHHITRPGYQMDKLESCIQYIKSKWNLDVYLEPGEAVALNAGYFLTKILDVVENNGISIAILDGSAACHMPDVIEMPYLPPLYHGMEAGTGPCTFRLAGPTCLAGDVIGDYSFISPLQEDGLLLFGDMAIYTTCKNNTFNGMPLPDIWTWKADHTLERTAHFSYADFKMRLGTMD